MGIMEDLAAELGQDAPIEIGTMFRSPGIRTLGKIVAFLGYDDELIVKLPRPRAEELIAEGTVTPVTMGTRTMREWVAVPVGSDPAATRHTWLPLAREALAFVTSTADAG